MATQLQPLFDATRFDPTRSALPRIELVRATSKATDVVIGVVGSQRRTTLIGTTAELEKEAGRGGLLALLLEQGASCEPGQIAALNLPSVRVLAVGLGEDLDLGAEDLRRAAGIGVRRIASITSTTPHRVAISLDATSDAQVRAVAEGALLASYQFAALKRERAASTIDSLAVVAPARTAGQVLDQARLLAQAVCVARDWINLPANLLGPQELVDQARGYLKDLKLDIEVLDERALEKGGYGGILAVGGGSVRPPRLLRIDYQPRGAKQHLVLVGKGITYDTGGYSIKPTDSMVTMKQDMAGAASVITAIRVIAERGLGIRVTAYAPLAESMISGSAYRPGDVLTIFDGTTVENMNSDCEGRIVLADALGRASTDDPDLVVDVATLTGACVVALGTRIGGLMASDDATADLLLDAAEAAGEEFWQLPITSHTRSQLKSKVADLASKGDRWGAASFAGAFLQHFVAPGVRWAHLDIAGPAWNRESAHDYVPADATGMSVRTLVALAESMAG